MLRLLITVVLFSTISCFEANNPDLRCGKYISRELNNITAIPVTVKTGATRFVEGSELNIKSDATFLFNTCSIHANGIWHIIDDSLSLFIQEAKLNNDSGLIGIDTLDNRFFRYKIVNDHLERIIINARGEKQISILEPENPQ